MVTGGFDGAVKTWSSDGKPVDSVTMVDVVQALCFVGASGHLWFTGARFASLGVDLPFAEVLGGGGGITCGLTLV